MVASSNCLGSVCKVTYGWSYTLATPQEWYKYFSFGNHRTLLDSDDELSSSVPISSKHDTNSSYWYWYIMKDSFLFKAYATDVCKKCLFSTVLLLPPSIVVGMQNSCLLSWQEAELRPWLLTCQILVLLTKPTHGAKHVIVLLTLPTVRAMEAHCHRAIEIGETCIALLW